jgi:hypothetical protein
MRGFGVQLHPDAKIGRLMQKCQNGRSERLWGCRLILRVAEIDDAFVGNYFRIALRIAIRPMIVMGFGYRVPVAIQIPCSPTSGSLRLVP